MVVDAAARRRGPARRRDRRDPVGARARRQRCRSRRIGSISFAATARAAARTRGAMAKRWAMQARSAGAVSETVAIRRPIRRVPARSWRSPIPTASPEAAAANGAFLLANGRGANVDPASALAREPFLAVAELAGTAAQSRILLAAPITLDEIERALRRPDRAPRGHHLRCRVGSLRGRAQRAARRDRAGRAAAAGRRPDAETRGSSGGRHRPARPRPAAVDASRCGNGATA